MSFIEQFADKTAKVMEIWMKHSPSATVGELLAHLEYIDRFDVYDDVCEDLKGALENGLLTGGESVYNNFANRFQPMASSTDIPSSELNSTDDSSLITYDDRPGYPYIYDALVLFAEEDRDFLNSWRINLESSNIRMCTLDDIQAGFQSPFEPAAMLMAKRCLRIIVVLSKEFVNSPTLQFYMNYAHAIGIVKEQRRFIPVVYKPCEIPYYLSHYTKLYYPQNSIFWLRMKIILQEARNWNQPRINNAASPSSTSNVGRGNSTECMQQYFGAIILPNTTYNYRTQQHTLAAENVSLSTPDKESAVSGRNKNKKKKENFLLRVTSFCGLKVH